jgi:hypothetical protein
VASVCDGAVAAFWFEQAYAYRSHAVIHALDLVSVELKLAHDRGREVNPADAQLGKCDRPLRALPAVLVADLADLQRASDGQSGAERPSKSGFPGLGSAYYTFGLMLAVRRAGTTNRWRAPLPGAEHGTIYALSRSEELDA